MSGFICPILYILIDIRLCFFHFHCRLDSQFWEKGLKSVLEDAFLRLHFGFCASSLRLWSFWKFSGAFPNECGWGVCKPHHWVHEETVYWYIIYNTEGTYSINQWIMSDAVFMKFYVAALLLMHRRTSPLDFLVHPNGAVFGSVYCFSLLCF